MKTILINPFYFRALLINKLRLLKFTYVQVTLEISRMMILQQFKMNILGWNLNVLFIYRFKSSILCKFDKIF